ncbi:MAG TPA: hypothetical protein VKB81_05505 [Nitrospira sp.]|nr:hypothetical protein [Nitrospira sp.]
MKPLAFPNGRRFAFTIMDDTDVATVANVGPIYRLLADIGMRTTKTVWPVDCPEGSKNFSSSSTLEDPKYLDFVFSLERAGFEIAYHGATMESSRRERTARAIDKFLNLFQTPPRVYANHGYNRENLYWGADRIDIALLKSLYRRLNGECPDYYQGHRPGSPWWWGDIASAHISYIRNLTFDEINIRRVNPTMPYRDPWRSVVPWWFSASDAEDVRAFNSLLRVENQDRLERQGGVCIVATHLGKGFVMNGAVVPDTEHLLRRLASRPGWFIPVGSLLDWLIEQGVAGRLPASEWRRMQWRWFADLVARQIRLRLMKLVRCQADRRAS